MWDMSGILNILNDCVQEVCQVQQCFCSFVVKLRRIGLALGNGLELLLRNLKGIYFQVFL
jgi:hypothetical protein